LLPAIYEWLLFFSVALLFAVKAIEQSEWKARPSRTAPGHGICLQ
jgi:hypothetical protein